jgi:hypothetical protein
VAGPAGANAQPSETSETGKAPFTFGRGRTLQTGSVVRPTLQNSLPAHGAPWLRKGRSSAAAMTSIVAAPVNAALVTRIMTGFSSRGRRTGVSESGAAGLGGPALGLCGKRARQKAHRIHALPFLDHRLNGRVRPAHDMRRCLFAPARYALGMPPDSKICR